MNGRKRVKRWNAGKRYMHAKGGKRSAACVWEGRGERKEGRVLDPVHVGTDPDPASQNMKNWRRILPIVKL